MIQVDSDTLIRCLRGNPDAVRRVSRLQAEDLIACSVVTTFEVLSGAKPHQLAATETLLAPLVHLPVTEAIGRQAAAEYRYFRSQNVTLSMADLLIGCTARFHRIPLLTGNRQHFPIVDLILLEP